MWFQLGKLREEIPTQSAQLLVIVDIVGILMLISLIDTYAVCFRDHSAESLVFQHFKTLKFFHEAFRRD